MLRQKRLAIVLAISWLILVILAASLVDKPSPQPLRYMPAAPTVTDLR